jgi:hypothetical protein
MRFLLITIILITYGSLYPLEFLSPEDITLQISKLTNLKFWNSGISDAIANVFLFIPFGIAIQHTFKARSFKAILALVAITFIFAFLVQISQIWTPKRIPYGGDAIWNVFGCIIGIKIYATSSQFLKTMNVGIDWGRNIPLMVVASFIVIDLQPFIPTFDLETINNNFKAVTSTQGLSVIEIVRHSLFYFIPLTLWRVSISDSKVASKVFGGVVVVIFLQLFIVNSGIDNNTLLGACIAVLAFSISSNFVTTRTLLSCTTALIIFNSLSTFEYRGSVAFNWIPFAPGLGGNTLVNIFALLEKSLFYCLFFYLSSREKIQFSKACLTLSLIVFILEVLQINIKGATPDITESIVVLLAAYVMRAWLYKHEAEKAFKIDSDNVSSAPFVLLKNPRLKLFLFYLGAAVLAQTLFMSLPNLPYNIVELYRNGGTIVDFTFLYLAVFIAIFSMVWIAQNHSAKNISNLKLPLYSACSSMATLLLLKMAVTSESIADIAGSANITYQLTGPRIMGDFGYQMVMFFGEQNVRNLSQFTEPFIRFAALTGPLLYFLTLFLSFSYSLIFYKGIKLSNRIIDLIKSLVVLLPWLYLCKLISFDFSSTDNLNELIARDGNWGIGGGGYLYGLLLTIALTVTFIVYVITKKRIVSVITALLVLILSLPLSWFLLKNGLIDSFQKYRSTFSGVDFLLGPSRSELLPESELMMRWALVYLLAIFGLSITISLAQKLLKRDNTSNEKPIIVSNNLEKPMKLIATTKSPITLKKVMWIIMSVVGVSILTTYSQFFNLSVDISKKVVWASNDANIIFDHHTHSNFSDGKLSIEALVNLGSENGCDAIAITDHTDAKRSMAKKQLDEIKLARLFNPNMLIVRGAELNPPSYKGREHVNVLVSPYNEETLFEELKKRMSDKNQKLDDHQLFDLLNSFNTKEENVVAIYNHPSRKDKSEKENKIVFLKWSKDNDIFIGLSGAPGHQKTENIGRYSEKFKTINRWDPAIANVGSTLDQLLDEGHDVWGAIASSDYHNNNLDYAPCAFSRIHVTAPEKTYTGLMSALKKGTFWASHGKFLSQFKLVAEVYEKQLRLSPGESATIDTGSIVLIQIELARERDYFGLPLDIELITNCVTGKSGLLDSIRVPAFKNNAAVLIPVNKKGKDDQSCYLRSRVQVQTMDGIPNMAYSNHIRFFLN